MLGRCCARCKTPYGCGRGVCGCHADDWRVREQEALRDARADLIEELEAQERTRGRWL